MFEYIVLEQRVVSTRNLGEPKTVKTTQKPQNNKKHEKKHPKNPKKQKQKKNKKKEKNKPLTEKTKFQVETPKQNNLTTSDRGKKGY